ncbi:MAG TPA: PRC-barrel domain-containing protein [Acetobacteraceae bacterium]|nr:PRC-barrel domain-containing protein [Acetobacteraceae bacterium]
MPLFWPERELPWSAGRTTTAGRSRHALSGTQEGAHAMTRISLSGAAVTAMLLAAPGLALAANSGNNNNNDNNTTAATAYGSVGSGGYTGTAMPIPSNNGNNNNNNGNNGNKRPSQRNPTLADNGDARASKVIGTDVYNNQNQKIGSIDDVLIGRNGVWAVISTDKQKVAVPFQHFVFGDANRNGNDKLVLPGATQARLDSMPAFNYDATNYANNNNNNNTNNGNGGGVFGNGANNNAGVFGTGNNNNSNNNNNNKNNTNG